MRIGENEPVTLEWLMEDYLRHMKHHLGADSSGHAHARE